MSHTLVKTRKGLWAIVLLCIVILSIGTFFTFLPSNQDLASSDWMLEQILEDLAPYSQKTIYSSKVSQFFQEALIAEDFPHGQGFVLVQIRGKNVHFQSSRPDDLNEWGRDRKQTFQHFFQTLADKYQLPSIDFILSLDDSYDDEKSPPVPIFVMAKNQASLGRILIPDFEACLLEEMEKLRQTCKRAAEKFPWSKKNNRVFWRGASTGASITLQNYRELPRFKLTSYSNRYPWLDARFTQFVQGSPEVYKAMAQEGNELTRHVSIKKHFAYKYLLDIDGNSCTYSRCRWILLSNSTLLKPISQNIQWYYKTLEPYIHYVPLCEDLSDLQEVHQWLIAHDDEARKIALAGQKLASSLFSKTNIEKYVVTLFNEYAKIHQMD